MRIQNHTQSPSFGTLIITQEGRASIKRCRNVKTLEKLVQAKKDMVDTEYFDIVVGANLKCKIKSLKDAFFGVFDSTKYDNVRNGVNENILEMGDYGISRHTIYKNDDEYGYSVWETKELGDIENAEHIDKLVDIAKELDKAAVKQEKRTLLEKVYVQLAKKMQRILLT